MGLGERVGRGNLLDDFSTIYHLKFGVRDTVFHEKCNHRITIGKRVLITKNVRSTDKITTTDPYG